MRKTLVKVLILVTGYWLLVTGVSFAQDEDVGFIKRTWRKIIHRAKIEKKKEVPERKIEPEKIVYKELTKEKKIEIITNNLAIYQEEISAKIPNLLKETDKEGNTIYKFKKESGEVVDIKDLDDESLSKLYRRVANEAVLIRTERLNRQLQLIRQAQPPRIPKPPQPVVRPTQPPKVYTPPRIPKLPSPPAQQQRR